MILCSSRCIPRIKLAAAGKHPYQLIFKKLNEPNLIPIVEKSDSDLSTSVTSKKLLHIVWQSFKRSHFATFKWDVFRRLHLSENHCCKRQVCGFVSPFAIYTLHPLILGLVNICQSWLLDEAISGLKSSWHSFSGFLVMSICCEVAISSLRHSKITRDLPYAVKSSNPRQSSN